MIGDAPARTVTPARVDALAPPSLEDARGALGLSPDVIGDCMVFADMNGDGADDLVMSVQNRGLGVYVSAGRDGFGPFAPIALSSQGTHEFLLNCAAADFDDDGRVDLAVLRLGGRLALLHNDGASTPSFREEALDAPLVDATFLRPVDFDRDGHVDLVVGASYHGDDGLITCDPARPLDCHLEHAHLPDPYVLLRAPGERTTFTRVTLPVAGYSNGVAVLDVNDDGWPDLFSSNELGVNALSEAPHRAAPFDTLHMRGARRHNQGMGAAWGNFDGASCLYNADLGPSQLYCADADGALRDLGPDTCIAEASRYDVAWAPALLDANDDGYQDIYVANAVSAASDDELARSVQERGGFTDVYDLLLTGGPRQRFVARRVSPMFMHPTMATEVLTAVGDHDGDGRLEVAVARPSAQANARFSLITPSEASPRGHWLEVALARSGAATNILGAKVLLRVDGATLDWRVVGSGGSLGSSSATAHFGLGARTRVDAIGVRWPDGSTDIEWFEGPFAADRLMRVVEAR